MISLLGNIWIIAESWEIFQQSLHYEKYVKIQLNFSDFKRFFLLEFLGNFNFVNLWMIRKLSYFSSFCQIEVHIHIWIVNAFFNLVVAEEHYINFRI